MAKYFLEDFSKNHEILRQGFTDDFDFEIEYYRKGVDTTSEDYEFEKQLIYFQKSTLKIGDINKDGKDDTAIRYLMTPRHGNLYGFGWYIHSCTTHYECISIENKFKGGKFSDIEDIISIENGVVTTETYKFDLNTGRHLETPIIRKYKYRRGQFIELKSR